MAKPLSLILFLILSLSSLSTIKAIPVNNPNTQTRPDLSGSSTSSFIQVSCKATLYPSLCHQTLSRYSNIIGNSPRKLAMIALAVTLSKTKTTTHYILNLGKSRGIGQPELGALGVCVENVGDNVDDLSDSIQELININDGRGFEWHMNNLRTWISGALTGTDTCLEAFSERPMDGRIKGDISMRVNYVEKLTSIALSFVTRFGSSRNRIAYEGFEP